MPQVNWINTEGLLQFIFVSYPEEKTKLLFTYLIVNLYFVLHCKNRPLLKVAKVLVILADFH